MTLIRKSVQFYLLSFSNALIFRFETYYAKTLHAYLLTRSTPPPCTGCRVTNRVLRTSNDSSTGSQT
jgi:hypothetical protein